MEESYLKSLRVLPLREGDTVHKLSRCQWFSINLPIYEFAKVLKS